MKTKLISRNPIQRFQNSGKIPEGATMKWRTNNGYFGLFDHDVELIYQNGQWRSRTQPGKDLKKYPGTTKWADQKGANDRYFNENKSKNTKQKSNNNAKKFDPNRTLDPKKKHNYGQNEVDWEFYDGNWYVKFRDPKKDQKYYKVIEGTSGYTKDNQHHNVFKNGKWVPIPGNSTTSVNKTQSSGTTKTSTKSTKTTPSSTKRTYVDWGDGRGKSWTEYKDRLNDIDKGMYAGNDIRFIQEDLNNQYKNNDLIEWVKSQGYNPEALVTDNIWGSKTEEAYKWYMAWKNKLNQEHTAEQKAKEPYTTSYIPGDYNNLTHKDIANLGFNDYNTLYSWVGNNPNHWFAQDLMKRFGEIGTWDRQNIENNLGVSGRYGRNFLGNGDYADMFNSMKNYFSSYQNVGNQQQQQTNYQPYVSVNIPSYNDLRNNPEVFTGYLTNQLNNPYRRIFKKGGIVSKNPIKRFREGDAFEIDPKGKVIYVKGKVDIKSPEKPHPFNGNLLEPVSINTPYAPKHEYSTDGGKTWKSIDNGTKIVSSYKSIETIPGTKYKRKDNGEIFEKTFKQPYINMDVYSVNDEGVMHHKNISMPTETYKKYGNKTVDYYSNQVSNNKQQRIQQQTKSQQNQKSKQTQPKVKVVSTSQKPKSNKIVQKPQNNSNIPQKSIYQINYENAMRKYPYLRKFKDTRALQRFLNQNGANLKEDNLFGRKTERALQNFLNGIKFNSPEFTRENTMYLDEISFKPELRHEDDAYKNYELADYMDEEQLSNMVNEVFNKTFKKGGIISRNPIQRFKQNLTKIKF